MAKKESNKIKCTKCGKIKLSTRDYYKSASELNINNDCRLTICKDCVKDRYEKLLTCYEGKSNNAFRHLLMNLDEFYDEVLYESCISKDDMIGEYFRLVNGTKDRRDKTSINNTLDGESVNTESLDDGAISERLIIKWGRGRKTDDYVLLEQMYKQKCEDYPSNEPAERSIIASMCLLELDIADARLTDKKSVAPLEKQMSEKFKQLGINPSDQKRYDKESLLIFGNIMKIYENEKPIAVIQDRYKDIDEMHRYWNRNIIYPMCMLQELATGHYTLENGISEITLNPEIRKFMEGCVDEK